MLFLELEYIGQQADVLDRQAENLVLAQLLIRWIRGHEASKLIEGAIDVLLPAFQITDGDSMSDTGVKQIP